MALTPEARRLTEEHRRAQAANQQGFLREFLAAWRLLDVRDLDSSTPNWLQVVMRLIELFRQDSARLSLDYARRYRRLELPGADTSFPDIDFFDGVGPRVVRDLPGSARRVPRAGRGRPRNRIPLRPVDGRLVINWRDRDPQVEASLRVTGPHTIKHRIGQGEPPERALRNAEAHAGGAGLRHVNDGGRDTMLTVVRNDRAALGYIRVTQPGCCSFCAMLASRGPVFSTEWAAGGSNRRSDRHKKDPRTPFVGDGSFKVHDNCKCHIEVVYSEKTGWPGQGKEFQQMWNTYIQNKYSGEDALKAWRRLYERPDVFKRKLEEARPRRTRRRAA
jgi:hypothetical protein